MKKYDDLEKLKQKSKFVQDVMKPIEQTFDIREKATKDYNDPNSDFNLINRGVKMENELATNCEYAIVKNPVSLIMTADEMFKELGYEKISDCEYKRIKPDKYGREVFITVDEDDGEVIKYIKDKELNASIAEWISNKELEAIYKKIEEIQKGEQDE